MSESKPKREMELSPASLKKPLPPGRSFEQIRNHFEVERELADRLLRACRSDRTEILLTMYDELFEKVPDHPRLTKREDSQATSVANQGKFPLLQKWLRPDNVILEFAPGDCRFAFELAKRVQRVYGIDISNQIGENANVPENFQLVVYDGYNADLPDEAIDLAFSDQLIEHFHPEDLEHHFQLVNRLLRKGGVYVFRTPHPFTGPHDVSQYFSETPLGFHLKEWTYTELKNLLKRTGYSEIRGVVVRRKLNVQLPFLIFQMVEKFGNRLKKKSQAQLGRLFLPEVNIVAVKK
jgi:SAM-dependent methyltransferase